MGLRNPLYLDAETLASLAEYYEVGVDRMREVVETQRRTRSGGGKLGLGMAEAEGALGRDVETQLSYSIEPSQKAVVSKTIDGLLQTTGALVPFDDAHARQVDDLMELSGDVVMTPTSLAGKMLYLFREYLGQESTDMNALMQGRPLSQAEVLPLIQRAYFNGALPPIPLLMELRSPQFPVRAFVSLPHSGFVDSAEASHIEGERRVLGQIAHLVAGGKEGYLSAEKWLLHGWDYMVRRVLMASLDKTVSDMIDRLGISLEAQDVQEYITGPAIVLNAVAVY